MLRAGLVIALPGAICDPLRNMGRTMSPALISVIATAACVLVTVSADSLQIGVQEIPLNDAYAVLPSYLQYIQNQCVLPANGGTDTCKQLTIAICGPNSAGDVASGNPNPCTVLRGRYVYPFSNYENTAPISGTGCEMTNNCKHSLNCPVSPYIDASLVRCMVLDPTTSLQSEPVGMIDPNSLVAWAKYIKACYGSNYDPAVTPPATCGRLSGDLCSRPDVLCDATGTYFYDTAVMCNLYQKVVALTSDPGSVTVSSVKPFSRKLILNGGGAPSSPLILIG